MNIKTVYFKSGQKKYERYLLNGELHREGAPAFYSWYENGQKRYERYYINGKMHREDGPAYKNWYENGQLKCETYYINDEQHRKDLPASYYWWENGQKRWENYYLNDSYHRTDGPAINEWFENGIKNDKFSYYLNGSLHMTYEPNYKYNLHIGYYEEFKSSSINVPITFLKKIKHFNVVCNMEHLIQISHYTYYFHRNQNYICTIKDNKYFITSSKSTTNENVTWMNQDNKNEPNFGYVYNEEDFKKLFKLSIQLIRSFKLETIEKTTNN